MISFKSILKISVPIMIGSAVQNLITLTDTFFLGRVEGKEVDYLAAIGLVGVFYLLITTIGYSFTRAGQIMIARRQGAGEKEQVGLITHAMGFFALLLAFIMFLLMKFGASTFFGWFVKLLLLFLVPLELKISLKFSISAILVDNLTKN